MKARKSNTNGQWKEIKYVQLEDSDILYKAEVMEFDVPLSESELYEQRGLESRLQDYWQDVRERAAIAAMQGILCAPIVEGIDHNPSKEHIAELAVAQADALIAILKEKSK